MTEEQIKEVMRIRSARALGMRYSFPTHSACFPARTPIVGDTKGLGRTNAGQWQITRAPGRQSAKSMRRSRKPMILLACAAATAGICSHAQNGSRGLK